MHSEKLPKYHKTISGVDGHHYKKDEIGKLSDLEIWRLFKKGNESAFIFIYDFYFSNLVNYGLNFILNRDVVKDCIQDMFIELREKRASVSETNAIKPFLFTILRRKIHHLIRKYTKRNEVDLAPSAERFQFVLSHEHHLINRQINDEQTEKLRKAILQLTVKEREAIFHFYFEDHSYQQIADIMGYADVKTARNIVYRAIASLRNILESSSGSFLLGLL